MSSLIQMQVCRITLELKPRARIEPPQGNKGYLTGMLPPVAFNGLLGGASQTFVSEAKNSTRRHEGQTYISRFVCPTKISPRSPKIPQFAPSWNVLVPRN